jgi:threonyl-tRNA synthetase
MWQQSEAALRQALKELDVPYYESIGDAAFYGPKLDVQVANVLGKDETISTVQLDFTLPERFGLEYIGEDGQPHRPYMVHRALLGSMERFFGVLIEHFGGAFPVWMAPVQVSVIPIADRHVEYAREVTQKLRAEGMRVELDERSERMNAKIRDAQNQKVPYMLVLGDNEMNNGCVSLRVRDGSQQNNITLDEFMARAKDHIAKRASEL